MVAYHLCHYHPGSSHFHGTKKAISYCCQYQQTVVTSQCRLKELNIDKAEENMSPREFCCPPLSRILHTVQLLSCGDRSHLSWSDMEDCDTHLINLLSDILSIQLVDLVGMTKEAFSPFESLYFVVNRLLVTLITVSGCFGFFKLPSILF